MVHKGNTPTLLHNWSLACIQMEQPMSPSPLPPLPNPSPRLQACVIIPARDESEGISSTLDCFAGQLDLNDEPLDPARFEVLLLANNCEDETAATARAWATAH